jgi:hypothetical protein
MVWHTFCKKDYVKRWKKGNENPLSSQMQTMRMDKTIHDYSQEELEEKE